MVKLKQNRIIRNVIEEQSSPAIKERFIPYNETLESIELTGRPTSEGLNIELVQRKAYQIYLEKGGYAIDNWLEAEQMIKNDELMVSAQDFL